MLMDYGFYSSLFKKTEDFWEEQNVREVVYEFDGQKYHAWQCREHILYRTEDRLDADCTLAVPCRFECAENLDNWAKPFVYPESIFREQVQNGESRRFAFYDAKAARGTPVLLFAPGGTGTFYDYYAYTGRPSESPARGVRKPDGTYGQPPGYGFDVHQRGYDYQGFENGDILDFSWDEHRSAHGLCDNRDVLTCSSETLKRLCEDVFVHLIWSRMDDPYVGYAERPDIPLHFDSGSQDELERITRCICRLDENVFAQDRNDDFYVSYYSTTPWQRESYGDKAGLIRCHLSDQSKERCAQVFARNSFHGGHWVPGGYDEFNPRYTHYKMKPLRIGIDTPRPTPDERAQAQRMLDEWLAVS